MTCAFYEKIASYNSYILQDSELMMVHVQEFIANLVHKSCYLENDSEDFLLIRLVLFLIRVSDVE